MDNDQSNPTIDDEENGDELQSDLDAPKGDIVEPGEALAETVANQGVDPADVVEGDDQIGEHIAEAEEKTPV
jgi:hypothetical protein